jgi:UDP:flavonoid glycosyltransferase YjiC (YdhE family)
MSRFLITCIGSYGDLHPCLALGKGLQSAGHDVLVATPNIFSNKVIAAGLTHVTLRPNFDPAISPLTKHLMDPFRGPEILIRKLIMPSLAAMKEDLEPHIEWCDVLINSPLAMMGPILAVKHHKPWVGLALAPFSFFSSSDPAAFPGALWTRELIRHFPWVNSLIKSISAWGTSFWIGPLLKQYKKEGVQPYGHPLFKGLFSPNLNLALFDPLFGEPQADWPTNTIQTGTLFYDTPDIETEVLPDGVNTFLTNYKSPALITLGSAAVLTPGQFYNIVFNTYCKNRQPAIVLMGPYAELPTNLPAHILPLAYAPFHQLMPRCGYVVHQGGVGTTAQVLRAGKPQLVIPFGYDQYDNAMRMKALGIAQVLPKANLTQQRFQKTLQQLLSSPTITTRAKTLSKSVKPLDDSMAETIEKLTSFAQQHIHPSF